MRNSTSTMDQFLESIEKRAFRMAQIATGNTEDALDIVQDAMMSLVKRYGHKNEIELTPLFYRILMNRIRDWYRRTAVRNRWRTWLQSVHKDDDGSREDPLEQMPDPAGRSPADHVAIGDSMAALDAAIHALPLRQQQAFLLRAWEELSVSDTASVMKCSTGSVKTHYSRAVTALRDALEAHRP